jgi:hypothetical protein
MDQQTVRKILGGKHTTIPIGALKQLPGHLHDPIMVLDSDTHSGSYVFMTSLLDDEGKTIIAVIHIEKRVGRYIVHDVASFYSKDSDRWFVGQIERGNLKYADKERSRKWLMTRGLYLPKVRGAIYGSKNKLLSKDDLVKKNEDVKYTRKGELSAENAMQKTRAFERIMEGFAREISVDREQMMEGVLVEHMFMKEQNARSKEIVENNYDQALRMLYGQEPLPEGLRFANLAEWVAMTAAESGDIQTLNALDEVYAKRQAMMGQEIAAGYVEGSPLNAIGKSRKSVKT